MKTEMINTVIERANQMLLNSEINSIYQSFDSKEMAHDWLIKSAIATLVIPVEKR